jgi:cytochrome c peroxidase
VFKVPGLRNVVSTAPYFHDGSAKTLSIAIRVMAGSQLSREISSKEVNRIQAFLETLTGKQGGGNP